MPAISEIKCTFVRNEQEEVYLVFRCEDDATKASHYIEHASIVCYGGYYNALKF